MRYYIIAGEASGDLHGSNLIREIKKRDPSADIRCWGGDMMRSAGATLVKHYRDLAFMGFIEVLANIRTILRNMRFCKRDILDFQPDVVIFIDYPGFNIPIAAFAKKHAFRTVYYISPQVWAWKEGRVKKIKASVDKMLVILPFEKEFYKKWDFTVEYVGHPLVEVIEESRNTTPGNDRPLKKKTDKPLVALLPGSRKQEVRIKLPVMLAVVKHFPDCRFAVAQAPGLEDAFIEAFTSKYSNVDTVKGDTYGLLKEADAALVTSGTATLETALFGVPEVVCYKGSRISYLIAKRLIRVPYISLVNLIMGKEVVKELIQDDMNEKNLITELKKILFDAASRERMLSDYDALRSLLREGGNASAKAADSIATVLASKPSTK
jgi:lipid-A-disaccharide synthase